MLVYFFGVTCLELLSSASLIRTLIATRDFSTTAKLLKAASHRRSELNQTRQCERCFIVDCGQATTQHDHTHYCPTSYTQLWPVVHPAAYPEGGQWGQLPHPLVTKNLGQFSVVGLDNMVRWHMNRYTDKIEDYRTGAAIHSQLLWNLA